MNTISLLNKLENEIKIKLDEVQPNKSKAADFLDIEKRISKGNISLYQKGDPVACYQTTEKKISSLILVNIGLNKIPEIIFEFKDLEILILNGNKIAFIDNKIKLLGNLKFIDLSNNSITIWPNELELAKQLKAIDLSYNKIKIIPQGISKLKNLTALFLSGNNIELLSTAIWKVKNLWNAHDVWISNIMQRISVDTVRNHDQLYSPSEILEQNLLQSFRVGLHAQDSQIDNLPPEILFKRSYSIREYWRSLEETTHRPLNEVKIILIGEGGSGKTSLLKRLTSNEFDAKESQTHGINIKEWPILKNDTQITARIWDFGGQEIMHSTHQFFLSKRSLYLIIVDSRKDEKIEYWLKHIESFGGNSPVLVVINKIDENPGFDLNRTFIQDKYKNIQSFHRVSCLTLEGIKTLEDSIVKSMDNVRHLNTLWRSEWFDVKDDLQRINKDYISINHYLKICNKHLIKERAEQYELLSFLSDLGIMLNYQDLALHDTNVLNPRWITSAVYQIINSKVVADSHGTLQLSSLQSILDNDIYSISKHNYIISIMKKFELCYDLGNDRVLIPDLLKIEESESVIEPNIKFYIQYNFLPKSIIPRFIVRMHKNIKEGDNWRTGAVLNSQHYSSKAIVKSDEEDRKIIILVEGGQARDFFNIIRDTLENINVSFEKLQYEERVVVPKTNVSISHKHLLLLERMGRDEYLPEGTSEPISVSEVLGTVTVTEKEKLENRILQHLIFLREKFNDKDTILSEVNKIIEIKPNIAGIGINVNALLEKLFKK